MIITVIWIFFIIIGVINWLGSHDKEGSIMGLLEIIVGLLIHYTYLLTLFISDNM